MIDLSNTELILTLTSVTPRESRERIETREQVLLKKQVIVSFTKLLNEGSLTDSQMDELQETIFDQLWPLIHRVAQTIESGLSKGEWEDAGRPDWEPSA